jgi:triacylglycerol lipase
MLAVERQDTEVERLNLPSPQLPIHLPPIWREGRTAMELAALLRDPTYRDPDPKVGRGQPVLLIPGFLAGDETLGVMSRWLRRSGYETFGAGMRLNAGCATAAADALEARVEEHFHSHGQRVAVVGHSHGGTLGRSLATRRPDLVAGVIALAAPLVDTLAIHPLARVPVRLVSRLGSLGAPGLFRDECVTGECCSEVWDAVSRPFPPGVGFVSIYSRSDGLVDWRACLDPRARAVEVRASHIGMAVSAPAYREVARALADFAAARRRLTARRSAARASAGPGGRRSSRPTARSAA